MKKTHLVLILLAVTHGLFALGESCPYENEKGYIPQDVGLQLIRDLKEKNPVILNGTKMMLIQATQVAR